VSVLVAGVVAFAAARFLDTRLDEPFGVVVGGIVGSAVYVPVVLATGGVSVAEVRRMLDRGRERITRRRRRRAST
jgi:hypothetical protein